MPLFFFHTADGHVFRDRLGTDLVDIDAAKAQAFQLAGRMLQDNAAELWREGGWSIAVTGEGGLELFRVDVVATESSALKRG